MELHTLTASVTSAVASKMLVYPLDTIAIQRQTNTSRSLFPASQSFASSARGLYRGLGISMVMTTPAVALYLCTYRQAKESLMPYLGESNLNYVASGTCAELISSFIWTPQEILKARLQISTTSSQFTHQIRSIYRSEGMRGFYRGYGMGLLVFIPYNAIWWSMYENSKTMARNKGLHEPAQQAAIASFCATTIATSCLHPFDLIKTRYQVSTSDGIIQSRGMDRHGLRHVFSNVIKEAGWSGLYAGIGPRLLCSIPGSVIAMAVFEFIKPDYQSSIS